MSSCEWWTRWKLGKSKRNFSKLYQNYLLEQRTVEYLSVPTPMSATVSACLSLEKYFCSFSNKISCVISESIPVPYFEDEEKRCSWRGKTIFLLSKTLRSQRAKEEIWPILSAVLQPHYIRSIKPNNVKSVDCGLRTTDSGPHLCEKTLLPI